MAHAERNTPPATRSRASTIILSGGTEPCTPTSSQPAMTPPASSSPTSAERLLAQIEAQEDPVSDFKPLRMLMETPLSVECGEKLSRKLTLHEELLRCHSKTFNELCAKAKPLREQYARSKALVDQMASYMFPEVTAKQFEEATMEVKAIPLILHIHDKYPLVEHHAAIKKTIDTAVEEQITRKNTKTPVTKKDSRDLDFKGRLQMLNSRGVLAVAEQVFAKLHKLNKAEKIKAKSDRVRALAQQRILLPDTDEATLRSFVQWIYNGTLHYQNAEHLYALLNLSTYLGSQALTERCLTQLYNDASDIIQDALAQGIRLQTLLGFDDLGPADKVLEVVFFNVFKDESPPERLLQLIIDTLAENLDMELWMNFKDLIGHRMALRIIEAMIVRQQLKTEGSDHTSAKSEDHDTAPEQSPHIIFNKH